MVVDARGVLPHAGVVEPVEAPVEPAVGVEPARVLADDRARGDRDGGVALLAENLRHRRHALRNPHAPVRLPGEPGRGEAGQERVDRREGTGRLGPGLLEEEALLGEGIEMGRGGAPVAVGSQALGAERVDQEDDHVRPGRRLGLAGAACDSERARRPEQEREARRHQASAAAPCTPRSRHRAEHTQPVHLHNRAGHSRPRAFGSKKFPSETPCPPSGGAEGPTSTGCPALPARRYGCGYQAVPTFLPD